MSKKLGSRPALCLFHGRRKNRTMQSLLKSSELLHCCSTHTPLVKTSHMTKVQVSGMGKSTIPIGKPWQEGGGKKIMHQWDLGMWEEEFWFLLDSRQAVQSWDAPVAIQWGSLTEGEQLPEGCGSRHQSHTRSPEATNPENSRHRPLAWSMDVLSFTKAF